MKIIELAGTCSSQEIGDFAEKSGKKFSYKKACKLIQEYSTAIYNELALHLRNPWADNTNIKTGTLYGNKGTYLHIVHSTVDYIFLIEK